MDTVKSVTRNPDRSITLQFRFTDDPRVVVVSGGHFVTITLSPSEANRLVGMLDQAGGAPPADPPFAWFD